MVFRYVISRLPLAIEATMTLTVASLRLHRRSQSETSALLGIARPASVPSASPSGASSEAIRIGRAVERVAAVLPWHPVCLPRAVAAASMLQRRGIACCAHLGVRDDKPPEAHAWVTVGGVVVEGAPIDGVTELASFL